MITERAGTRRPKSAPRMDIVLAFLTRIKRPANMLEIADRLQKDMGGALHWESSDVFNALRRLAGKGRVKRITRDMWVATGDPVASLPR